MKAYLDQINQLIETALGLVKPVFKKVEKVPLTLEYISKTTDLKNRSIEYYFENHLQLTGHDISSAIYNSLTVREDFQKLGSRKVIITTGRDIDNTTFNVHPPTGTAVGFNITTSLEDFKSCVDHEIGNRYDESGYIAEVTQYFIVIVWSA